MGYKEEIKKLREDRNKLPSQDGIKPNFTLISSYYKNFSEESFYRNYARLKKNGIFKEAERIIIEFKLQSYKSDLICFLVGIASNREFLLMEKGINPPKLRADFIKQRKILLEFISKLNRLNFNSKYSFSETSKFPELKEIKFVTNKKDHNLRIDSSDLCAGMLGLIEEWLIKDEELDKSYYPKEKSNISPRQYDRIFVSGLKPFIDYLNKETIKWQSKKKIYDFVSEFLDILGCDITPERIKDTLKAKQH